MILALAFPMLPAAFAGDDAPTTGTPDAPAGAAAGSSTTIPAPAEAPPTRGTLAGGALHGAEDARFRYWREGKLAGFEDDPRDILDYAEFVERLDLAGGNAHTTAAARIDGVGLFGNQYILDDQLHEERNLLGDGLSFPVPDAFVDIEKISLESRGRLTRGVIGDSYLSFGRGYAVNLVKNTDIDVDTSIRGVQGVLTTQNWGVTVASGITNPQQVALENPNLNLQPDLFHAVTGVDVQRYGVGPVNLDAHGVLVQFERDPADPAGKLAAYGQPIGAAVAGATVEALGLGGIDWFAEGDYFAYDAPEIPVKNGHAIYASASAYPGRTTLLAEFRRSKNTEYINALSTGYEIASGPTLEYERVITEDSSAAVNSNDITGGRVRADFRLRDDITLIPYVSMAAFRDADLGGLHFNRSPETILHPIVGVQYVKGDLHLIANAGHREDLRDPGAGGMDLGADRMTHADVDLSVPIAGKVSLELAPTIMRFDWGNNAQQQTDYTDFSNALAVKIGSPWAFIAYTDFSNNPLLPTRGNISDDVYAAIEAQWMPGPATTLKAFYGAYRGGIRCAGGQCRSLPGFDGVKFSFSTTF